MRYLVTLALFLAALFTAGCGLTPQQAKALADFDGKVRSVETRLAEYEPQLKAVVEKIKAKEIPEAEGIRLLAEIAANRKADMAKLTDLKACAKELQDQKVPWWYYVGPVLAAVLGVAGGYIPKAKQAAEVVRQLDQAGRVIGTLVRGVEKAGNGETKAAIAAEATLTGVGVTLHETVSKLT